VLPALLYAATSDTLVVEIQQRVLDRRGRTDTQATLAGLVGKLARAVGGVLLWLLRLVLAGRSTLGGLRQWVVETVPVAPGRRAVAKVGVAAPTPIVVKVVRGPHMKVTAASPTTWSRPPVMWWPPPRSASAGQRRTLAEPPATTTAPPAPAGHLAEISAPPDIPLVPIATSKLAATAANGTASQPVNGAANGRPTDASGQRPVIEADNQPDTDTDTEADRPTKARRLLAADPKMTGAELGRRLGVSERTGRRLHARLAAEPKSGRTPEGK
jgi:hypothetical protein